MNTSSPTVPEISLVLPVHRQADHIAAAVQGLHGALVDLRAAFEIILVPNGPDDGSKDICARLAADLAGVRSVESPVGGWGNAVRLGISAAKGGLIAYSNSARTHPQELTALLQASLSEPTAVIKAIRPLRGSLMRGVGSWLYNLECRVLLGIGTKDINGTPKIFRREFAALLALQSPGDLIDLEFLCLCKVHGYPVLEIALMQHRRYGGRSTTGWRTAVGLYAGAIRFLIKGLP